MTKPRPAYVFSDPTVMPAVPDPLAGLSEAERAVVLAMRRVDFCRAGRERTMVIHWNGVRPRVFDTEQISA